MEDPGNIPYPTAIERHCYELLLHGRQPARIGIPA